MQIMQFILMRAKGEPEAEYLHRRFACESSRNADVMIDKVESYWEP